MPVVNYTTVNGRILHEDRGGVKTLFMPDTLGNVIETRNMDTGAQTSSTTYWPYGEVRTQTGTNPSPFGFCGKWGYYTQAGQPTYVRARYYRPNLGRWQTVDPLWPWESAYGYAKIDPLKQIDPTGLYTEGPDKGGPVPRYTLPPQFYHYGNYCGLNNWKSGCDRPKPLNCIDEACQRHDDCLDKADYWGPSGTICNCRLLWEAITCFELAGCKWPHVAKQPKCVATRDIILVFSAICLLGGRDGGGVGSHPVYKPGPWDLPSGPPPGSNVGTPTRPVYV
jgi:RHS repeat-associated protein